MQELIKIEKNVIGTDKTNSVNARELWKNLEIKKKFADWMNHQINSLGLELNVDYILISPKRENNFHSVELPLFFISWVPTSICI